MKKIFFKAILFISLFILALFACNLFYSNYYDSDFVRINIRAKYENSDRLQVFYHLKKDSLSKAYPFNSSRSVTHLVEGSADFQEIKIVLPTSETIDKLRIDHTVGAEKIEIEYIRIAKKDVYKTIRPEDFSETFSLSKFSQISVVEDKLVILNKKIDDKLDPHFIISNLSFLYSKSPQPWEWIKYLISLFIAGVFFLYINISYQFSIKTNDAQNLITILLFLLIIFLPGLLTLYTNSTRNDIIASEKVKNVSENFEEYFSQNFGLRNTFLDINTYMSLDLFNISPNPERAIIGKIYWFFYSRNDVPNSYFSALDDYLHINLLNSEKLENLLIRINKRDSIVKGIDGVYFKFVYPNKASIYPEFLPSRLKPSSKISRLDQVTSYFTANDSKIKIIDFKEELKKIRHELPLYYKFDTHWNSYGAFLSYQIIEKNIKNKTDDLVLLDYDSYQVSWRVEEYGDLLKATNIEVDFTILFLMSINLRPTFTIKKIR